MTPEEFKGIQKQAIKEAIQEWLDKQYTAVGRWTTRGLLSMAVVAIFYVYATAHGWIIKL